MTQRSNARLAGSSFLLYVALGIPAMILMNRASAGGGLAATLASLAEHVTDVKIAALLVLFGGFCAIALGVSLYALTRDQDRDLAVLAMVFRVAEGILGGIAAQRTLSVAWLASASGDQAPSPEAARALGAFLLHGQGGPVAALFFAAGSTLFCWLVLRGRLVPAPLAGLGLVASLLWMVGLPLQIFGVLRGAATYPLWILMAAFEVPFALWLIVKGVAPARRSAA